MEAEVRNDQIELYHSFARTFGMPQTVFYPGCGSDATPGVAFRDSTVVFLDPEHYALEIQTVLTDVLIVIGKAEDYTSMLEFDLVISMHSHAPFDDQVKDLRSGGHLIIANKMSYQAFDHPDFTLVGVSNAEIVDGDVVNAEILTGKLHVYEIEESGAEPSLFSNRRKYRQRYYVFKKV